jgi:hypothetical protein
MIGVRLDSNGFIIDAVWYGGEYFASHGRIIGVIHFTIKHENDKMFDSWG